MRVVRRFRYVVEDRSRHGKVRVYLRYPGAPQKVRLHAEPDTPEFDTEYRAALAKAKAGAPPPDAPKRPDVKPGSIWELYRIYRESAAFKRLAPRTQRVRMQVIELYLARWPKTGDVPFVYAPRSYFVRIRDLMQDRPEAANSLLKALRAMFDVALELNLVKTNPVKLVKYLQAENPEGFHSWTPEEQVQFKAFHAVGTKARLAFELLFETAQRRADIVRLGPSTLGADGKLRFTQTKNAARKPVHMVLRITPPLRAAIDATPAGVETFLVTNFGKPFTSDGFGNWFRRRCDEAGLPPRCAAHGLRKARAADLAERGASEAEIMSITGHRTSKEISRYTRAARQEVLSDRLTSRLGESSHPSRAAPEWDKIAS